MTYFDALPVAETQVGVGIETTGGLAVGPAYWIPVMGPKYAPNRQLLPDSTLQGSMVPIYDEIPGLRYDGHGWESFPYRDSLGVFLRGILGSADTKTTARASTPRLPPPPPCPHLLLLARPLSPPRRRSQRTAGSLLTRVEIVVAPATAGADSV